MSFSGYQLPLLINYFTITKETENRTNILHDNVSVYQKVSLRTQKTPAMPQSHHKEYL
jgi:hypothetical protein